MEHKKIKILAIDDIADNLISIKALIREAFPDALVLTAQNGLEGIALARMEAPDVILLDIVMPGMDGFAVCQALKADPQLRYIPVVFVTALKGDKENRICALEAGAEGFLNKPIDESELAAQVRAMVKIRTAHVRERDEKERLKGMVNERTAALEKELDERRKAERDLRYANIKLEAFWDIATLDDADPDTICRHLLASIVKMMGSEYGFFGFINQDESIMTIHAWSGEAMKGCGIVDKPMEFPINQAGVWGEVVRRRVPLIMNDYATGHPAKKGLPSGHVPLTKLLVVPVFSHGRIVSVAAVANRAADYNDTDVRQIKAFAESIQMIIDRKNAEAALLTSEERYRRITEGITDYLYSVRVEKGNVVETRHNAACERVTGYTSEEFAVDPDLWITMIPEDERDLMRARVGQIMAGGHTAPVEHRIRRKDGEVRWVSDAAIVQKDTRGAVVSYEGVIRDITEIRVMESRLRQSEKMDAVGQLAGGIAHDFNNVLGGIIGYTDMSLELAEKGSAIERNLSKVMQAADRAKNLVKQILTFSRQGNTQKTVVAIRPIIKEVLELLKASIPSSVVITSELARDTKPVFADSTKIHEMVLNLATNAVYAMNRKGKLAVRMHPAVIDEGVYGRTGKINPGEYVMIEISDTGCGMDAQTITKAFDPFFTTKPVGEGTGMGLSVVLGVVQSHGGDIQIESEPGKGTTFRIYLPVTEAVAATVVNATKEMVAGTERVLFVDDESILVEMAELILAKLGYTVTGMTDSLEALKFIQENGANVDILVTDQTMPGMTGVELVKEALAIKKNLPVILCTGFSRDIDVAKATHAGITRFMLKPYGSYEIVKAIRDVLDERMFSTVAGK